MLRERAAPSRRPRLVDGRYKREGSWPDKSVECRRPVLAVIIIWRYPRNPGHVMHGSTTFVHKGARTITRSSPESCTDARQGKARSPSDEYAHERDHVPPPSYERLPLYHE